ncbi:AAA domain-containing protein [uncultured Muribaculum sp.]|uniref:AAA domain-containing protein n=1 Tax=uncultured Muribaculum sp. TaxID=1918613 RepID=UPI0025D55198|nr:AAA domain-containing protein [uncultured Muribaculum sp.]
MELTQNLIIIDGVNKTSQIEAIEHRGDFYVVKFKNSTKAYNYRPEKIVWLRNPVALNISADTHIYINGQKKSDIESMTVFATRGRKYYAIRYGNGFVRQCDETEVEIHTSCLSEKAADIFSYFKQCAGINRLGIDEGEAGSSGILKSIYSNIDFIDSSTAASPYLNPAEGLNSNTFDRIIFPFGCNASQCNAVKAALLNQVSVIQGPPGTGKTQTILNIIANLLISNKSVLVVSNNNSAIQNVFIKLDKEGLGFLVAPLGRKENKELFIANQPQLNPELSFWQKASEELERAFNMVSENLNNIESVFKDQERLALCRQELADVEIEQYHFAQEHDNIDVPRPSINSEKILKLLDNLHKLATSSCGGRTGFAGQFNAFLKRAYLKLQLRWRLKIKTDLSKDSISDIINRTELAFYQQRIGEIKSDIENLESNLADVDAKAVMKSLTDESMSILKAILSRRYNRERCPIKSIGELYLNGDRVIKDYPVVLSTTFSAKTCFKPDTLFDYVIMDEASQVSVETGLLALSCAKNAVIVGDRQQLPNVIKDEDKVVLKDFIKIADIPECYDSAEHSFLSSIIATLPNAPETLLREHYRCHPDIINFCNQKFYGGNLIIMTQRHGGDTPLSAIVTAEGHHSRGHYNQREIDTVKLELLPQLDNRDDIGIISPYNDQVAQFKIQLPEIEAATIHKYQGREKSVIILSVTDDKITNFADNANMLNVAVSRAKDRFCLVVSGNPQELKGNIHDLLGYIRYRHGAIVQSNLHSIFDYLFSRISEYRRNQEAISEFESENLTFELINKIRLSTPELSHIKTLCHYPLHNLIRDKSKLSEREAKYASHPSTHIDFLIINRVSKEPILAIETDGYNYHNEKSKQFHRDRLKDHILEIYNIPLLRISTIGHSEEMRITEALLRSR